MRNSIGKKEYKVEKKHQKWACKKSASRCVFLKVAKKTLKIMNVKNTYPSSRDVQKAKKMWNTFTIFHQNEASLWRLARSISVYGWEKGDRKIVWNVNANRHPNWSVQKHISVDPWGKKSGKIVEFSQTISFKRGVTVTLGSQLARLRMEKNVLAKQCTNCTLF